MSLHLGTSDGNRFTGGAMNTPEDAQAPLESMTAQQLYDELERLRRERLSMLQSKHDPKSHEQIIRRIFRVRALLNRERNTGGNR